MARLQSQLGASMATGWVKLVFLDEMMQDVVTWVGMELCA
jgi:hypothetical protein